MIGPDDIRDMRPESPMPRPERSADWLAGWRAAQEALVYAAQRRAAICWDAVHEIDAGRLYQDIPNARATENCAALEADHIVSIQRAMRPEGEP